jgi:magnesium transporter
MEGHPEAAAALLEGFAPGSIAAALAAATPTIAAGVLGQMAPGSASASLLELPPGSARDLLEILPLHVASALLRRVPAEHRERLLASLTRTVSGPLARLLDYPARTAGALLDPLVTAIPLDVSARDAIEAVRAFPERVDHEVFVIRRDQTLIGSIALRALVAAPATVRLETLATPVGARFSAFSDAKTLLASPAWADTHTVPVVDGGGLYLGALRYEAILRLAADTATVPISAAAVSTLVSLSELCWTGCAGLVAELTAAAIRTSPPSRDGHGV